MRPISLKIKGLNSFNEEQFIDFEELTSEGLFGIFGPTGSGKSTVLDGITLALYGKIARDSSNFINTNCDSMSVSYRFQISGADIKRYEVDREFKRDKKTGGIKAGKCKIVDITVEEDPIILADKVKEVTSECTDIIGLGIDDFTRTVVLPQGKFSEFLKLEGKERRDMLERLFNLQEYGDELAFKLKSEINREKTKNSELLGQLMGYEDVSDEILKAKEEELKDAESKVKAAQEEMKAVEAKFKESEELWNLLIELRGQQELKLKLENQKEEIERKKVLKERGEAALKVLPFIKSYEEVLKKLEETRESLKNIEVRFEAVKAQKEENEVQWKLWNAKKEGELPELKVKEQRLSEAIEEERAVDKLKLEAEQLKAEIANDSKIEAEKNTAIKELEERLLKGKLVTEETEKEVESLKLDNDFKVLVQQGLVIEEKYNDLKLRIESENKKTESLRLKVKEISETLEIINKKHEEKNTLLKESSEKLKILTDNCPGTQEDLIKMQKKVLEDSDRWEKYNSYQKDIKSAEDEIKNIDKDKEAENKRKDDISGEIDKLKQTLKEIQVENLAQNLRASLSEGDICPVCGSTHHHMEDIKAVESGREQDLEAELSSKENELKEIEKSITMKEARKETSKALIESSNDNIKSLGEEFKLKTTEDMQKEFKEFSDKLNDYSQNKEKLEAEGRKLNEEVLSLEGEKKTNSSLLASGEKQLEEAVKESESYLAEIRNMDCSLKELREKTGVESFREKNSEIQETESKRQKAEGKLKKCRELYEKLQSEKETSLKSLNEIREVLVKKTSTLNEKQNNINDKIKALSDKFGENIDFTDELQKVIKSKVEIESTFERLNAVKEKLEEEFVNCNAALIESKTKQQEFEKREESESENVKALLKETEFASIEQVKAESLSVDELNNLSEEIQEYITRVAKVIGAMESISGKINGRDITEEEWNKVKGEKADKDNEILELNEAKIKVSEEVSSIKKKLSELGDLKVKKEKLEHKLSLLADLEKLFKGKKFVEFVAAHRLKYISLEASKRLKDISSGTYGLEVDENGRFIIRDYKNGGAARDASTLSGGETFLTSLALALALSAEIQLKGTAPLELFFLDEGFGTLDDNLLDIVMSSLERIHNDKLKIGIISHVESIKNRMPVKLILTPAEAGMGGSKVRIEKN